MYPGGCDKSAVGQTDLCVAHGGGRRCLYPGGCDKGRKRSNGFVRRSWRWEGGVCILEVVTRVLWVKLICASLTEAEGGVCILVVVTRLPEVKLICVSLMEEAEGVCFLADVTRVPKVKRICAKVMEAEGGVCFQRSVTWRAISGSQFCTSHTRLIKKRGLSEMECIPRSEWKTMKATWGEEKEEEDEWFDVMPQ